MSEMRRRLAAEALGTGLLVATVVGSGIMAQRLTGDAALMLLCNTLPVGAILVVLITILAPVSGAHFNPAVSLVFALRREMDWRLALAYMPAQIAGGMAGAVLAHLMFAVAPISASAAIRGGLPNLLSESVASFALVAAILGGLNADRRAVPWLVALAIVAAYWFTASTSFANPAVTLARALTDSFAGIAWADVPGYMVAQFCGAVGAWAMMGWLLLRPVQGSS